MCHQSLHRAIVMTSLVAVAMPSSRVSADDFSGCVSVSSRFPVVIEVPIPDSMKDIPSNPHVEMRSTGSGGDVLGGVGASTKVDQFGRTVATITWHGDAPARRAPTGTYDVVMTSPRGRMSTCVAVTRPITVKSVDRLRPPARPSVDVPSVDVIVIGRDMNRGGQQ